MNLQFKWIGGATWLKFHWGTFSHYVDKPDCYKEQGVIKVVEVGEIVTI